MNFPASPALNDIYSFSGKSWQWNGVFWASIPIEENDDAASVSATPNTLALRDANARTEVSRLQYTEQLVGLAGTNGRLRRHQGSSGTTSVASNSLYKLATITFTDSNQSVPIEGFFSTAGNAYVYTVKFILSASATGGGGVTKVIRYAVERITNGTAAIAALPEFVMYDDTATGQCHLVAKINSAAGSMLWEIKESDRVNAEHTAVESGLTAFSDVGMTLIPPYTDGVGRTFTDAITAPKFTGNIVGDAATYAAPVSLGAANAEGNAATFARSDHVHAFPTAAQVSAVPLAGGVTMTGPLSVPAGATGTQVPRRDEVVGIAGNETITGVKTHTATVTASVTTALGVGANAASPAFVIAAPSGTGGGGAAFMSFHRVGAYAINMGLDTDNVFRLGGWSQGLNAYRFSIDSAGNFTASGNITAYSDIRLKTDLTKIAGAVEKVKSLTGYTYTRIDSGERHTGLIAQDVQKVMPEAVMETDGNLSVAYGNLMGLLVEAIKELNDRIDQLEGKR